MLSAHFDDDDDDDEEEEEEEEEEEDYDNVSLKTSAYFF